MDHDKVEIVEALIRELEERFGPGVVYRLSQARPKVGERAVSTGSLGLDLASGIGGVPRGRVSLISGPDSCGKTSLAYHILARAQVEGGLAALIDGEVAADGEAMTRAGVDVNDLILASPSSPQEALEMADILVRCRALDALVVTEVAPTSAAARRLATGLKGSPTALVFVHTRPPRALTCDLHLALVPLRPLFDPGGDVVGLRVRATVTKNRLARPGEPVELTVLEGQGVHRAAELVEWGLRLGVLGRGASRSAPAQGVFWEQLALGRSTQQAAITLERDGMLAGKLEGAIRDLVTHAPRTHAQPPPLTLTLSLQGEREQAPPSPPGGEGRGEGGRYEPKNQVETRQPPSGHQP